MNRVINLKELINYIVKKKGVTYTEGIRSINNEIRSINKWISNE
jgi:hypothetical protein